MESVEKYIRRCFQLARLAQGKVAPNPMVGAVVVWNDKIIGEGFHKIFGLAHAEVNAIQNISPEQLPLLSQSTIYVSLEPCNFYGNTPPCVDLILKHRIPRVVISCLDPNPKVSGQGIQKLLAAGVEVQSGVLEAEGRRLLGGFSRRHEQKRPQVILKYAVSANGYLGVSGQQLWLTNPFSKRLVHKWRSEIDAIIIGTNTAATDNPQLTTRYYFDRSPLRVVLDRTGRLPKHLDLFNDPFPTLLVTERADLTSYEGHYANTQFLVLPFDHLLLPTLLKDLAERGCNTVMVEGGAQLLQSFIDMQLWEEARVFRTPRWIERGILAPDLPQHLIAQRLQVLEDQLWIYRK